MENKFPTTYKKEERWIEPWVWREMMQLVSKVSDLLFKNVSPHFSYAECEIVLDLVKESIHKINDPDYKPKIVEIERSTNH